MRILVISNCPLNPEQGSGYVILGYCKEMIKRGHDVQVYGPEHYFAFPEITHAKRLRTFIGYNLKALLEVFSARKSYDIIELWGSAGWFSIILLRCLKIQGLRIISRSNGLETHYRFKSRTSTKYSLLRRLFFTCDSFLDELGFRYANALTVVSSYDEEFARKRGYKTPDRLLVIENPLPDQWLNREINRSHEVPVIGFVGSWVPRKGCTMLTEIINLVHQQRPEIQWMIAGVGSNGKNEIHNRTSLGSNSVFESVSKEKLEILYSKISYFLCLSDYESFGLVCAEAMSFGCTLISTDVGFMHGLRAGEDYVSVGNLAATRVADLLIHLINNPAISERIAQNGYGKVQRLEWKNAGDKLESFYLRLLGANQK